MVRAIDLHTPPTYVAHRVPTPITIDGDLTKPAWSAAAWSSDFQEIRGADAPADARPPAGCRTRLKMLWDDEFLYIGALLEYDDSLGIVATLTERNSPIFHADSDFEVFVDAAGSCHHYKELELNALNTVWNLLLDRPYADGGEEYSGRVATPGAPRHYDVAAQRTATRVLSGALNAAGGGSWSVEIALAHADTLARQPGAPPPAEGALWRINFSRVERRGAINWVWCPQVVWEPRARRYEGKVNMHLPDAWGRVRFAGAPGGGAAAPPPPDDEAAQLRRERCRVAAFAVYYAQQARREASGAFATELGELAELVDAEALTCVDEVALVGASADAFAVVARAGGAEAEVTHRRRCAMRG